MADAIKFFSRGGGNLFSDLNSFSSLLRTRRTVAFAYGFMLAFVLFTVFLAFNPSGSSSSPWFNNIFSSSSTSTSSSSTSSDSSSYRSQFSSIFSYFFPNSSQSVHTPPPLSPSLESNLTIPRSQNTTFPFPEPKAEGSSGKNQSAVTVSSKPNNNSQSSHRYEDLKANQTRISPPQSPVGNGTDKGVAEKSSVSNFTSSLSKNQNNGTSGDSSAKQGKENLLGSLMNCNIFNGKWVRDDSYPLYPPGSCPHIDEQFDCFLNGRPDPDYQKHKWQPMECNLPRLNGRDMLELLRGKRLVFVGDSLNRNMWESLVCILRNSVEDKSKVFEASGRREFRTEGSYSFVFKDYKCSVEFFRSPFLVQEWEMPETNGSKKETLRLDIIERSSDKYKSADIIVFNTGHWWTHEKTSKGKDYYQEGSHVYGELNVVEAFRKALTTWARWVDANINPKKTLVFFRGYSASHFSGGQWNSGGQCDSETEPIKNETYLKMYPPKMRVLEKVMKGMKTPVSYLNITRMTDYRKDAHPSIYRKQNLTKEEHRSPLRYQDCSHWCLPGVPDTWNELLYAQLLIKSHDIDFIETDFPSIGNANKDLDFYELEEDEVILPSSSESGELVPHPVIAEDSGSSLQPSGNDPQEQD
ncbi:hypothetical protein HHK36_017654 [Tetracentron sinense]|uniref:Trichome birefringence-like N-terminal domain-containing protein n=1 Tax=Tetracentron sinense TaxID=13715 RepID=A0A834YXH4_TETSI|nr:hypothetical protein HHK36_017654 [Tetracentron sinense]